MIPDEEESMASNDETGAVQITLKDIYREMLKLSGSVQSFEIRAQQLFSDMAILKKKVEDSEAANAAAKLDFVKLETRIQTYGIMVATVIPIIVTVLIKLVWK